MAKPPVKITKDALAWLKENSKQGKIVFAKKTIKKEILRYLKNENLLSDLSKDYCILKLADKSKEDFFKENYWQIISEYLKIKFKNDWYITGKAGYLSLSSSSQIPNENEQITISTKAASNTVFTLLGKYSIVASTDRNFEKSKIVKNKIKDTDLNFTKPELIIINSSLNQYKNYQEEIVSYLKKPNLDNDFIISYFENNSSPVLLARLIGALEQIENYSLRESLEKIFKISDHKISIENPFKDANYLNLPEMPEYQIRLEISIDKAKTVLSKLKKPQKLKTKIKDLSKIASKDGYHSLTIEGYNVTEALMDYVLEQSKIGKEGKKKSLKTALDESDLRNQLAAKGFMNVMEFLQGLIKKTYSINETLSKELFKKLWGPSINAKLINDREIYRNHFVSIRGSQHVPPNHEKISRLLESFYRHINDFDDGIELAIYLHYFYVKIHPHSDGNGRISRFLMNLALIQDKYNWLTIKSSSRDKYFQALEKSHISDDISYFANFIMQSYKKDNA